MPVIRKESRAPFHQFSTRHSHSGFDVSTAGGAGIPKAASKALGNGAVGARHRLLSAGATRPAHRLTGMDECKSCSWRAVVQPHIKWIHEA